MGRLVFTVWRPGLLMFMVSTEKQKVQTKGHTVFMVRQLQVVVGTLLRPLPVLVGVMVETLSAQEQATEHLVG